MSPPDHRIAITGPSQQDPTVTIYADRSGAYHLARVLREISDEPCRVDLVCPPEPASQPLNNLIVRLGHGPVTVEASEGTLHIAGGHEQLSKLAASFNFFADHHAETPGEHLHIEHWGPPEPHPWLDATAAPVVVGNWSSGQL